MAFTDPPPVASAPTAGKGLALTLRGLLPFNKYGSGPAPVGQVLTADGKGGAVFAATIYIIGGNITSAGDITSGTGFTVTKGVAGVYTINFAPNFATAPSVWFTTPDGGNLVAKVNNFPPTVSSVGVAIRDTTAGTLTDSAFLFGAVGIV